MGILHRIVWCILFLTFLKYLIVIEWNFTIFKLHTPSTEPCLLTVNRVTLHTTIEIDDMCVVNNIIISSTQTCVPSKEAIVSSFIYTTIRKNTYWKCKIYVRISIKQWISITNSCCWHCAISQCLVRVISNIMLC